MSQLVNNTLRGTSGGVTDETLAATATTGTVTTMAPGSLLNYHSSDSVSLGTGYRRPDSVVSTKGSATPALVPGGSLGTTWSIRAYMVQGSLGTNAWESRWIMDIGTSHGLVLRPDVNTGVFVYRIQPRDLAAGFINHSSFSGARPSANEAFRFEFRRNGNQLRLELFFGANINGTSPSGTYIWNSVPGLSGNFVRMTGFRYLGNVLLQIGSTGSAVRSRQNQLITLGYLPAGSADGSYGPQTSNAVQALQSDYALNPVDGEIGPETAAAMDQGIRDHNGTAPRTPLRYWELAILNTNEAVGPYTRSSQMPPVSATASIDTEVGDKHVDVSVGLSASAGVHSEVISRAPFAFPLGLVTEIKMPSGEWVEISPDVYNREDVQITRGRQDEASSIDSSRLTLLLNNRHGKYSPRNPDSPFFGKIGRNTPIRFSIRGPGVNPFRILAANEVYRSASGTLTAAAPSVDLQAANALFLTVWSALEGSTDLVTPGEMVSDYTASGAQSTIEFAREMRVHDGATGARDARTANDSLVNWTTTSIAIQGQLGVPILVDRQFDSNRGTADTTVSGAIPVQTGNMIVAIQVWEHDEDDEMQAPEGGPWGLVSDTVVADGGSPRIQVWSRRAAMDEALSVTFQGSPTVRDRAYAVYVMNDLTTPRFTGEVSSWPVTWDLSDNDVSVNIEASGVLRRLVQGSPPPQSALRRLIPRTNPHTYWPMTEPQGANQNLPVAGPSNLRPHDVTRAILFQNLPEYGSGNLAPWMEQTVQFAQGSTGRLAGLTAAGGTNSWTADYVRSGPGGSMQFEVRDDKEGSTASPQVTVVFDQNAASGNVNLRGTYRGGDDNAPDVAFNITGNVLRPDFFEGGPHHVRIVCEPTGARSTLSVYIDGGLVGSGLTPVNVQAGGPQAVTVRWNSTGEGESIGEMSIGHIVLWNNGDAPSISEINNAVDGYRFETAGRRLERLCAEEDVDFEFIGNIDETEEMGPQPTEAFLTLLNDCEDTDGGMLGESRRSVALLYRTRRSKYNQAPSVEFDYTKSQVADITVTDDDQRLANDVQVSTRFSGEESVEVTTGALSVSPPPMGVGRYATSVSSNPAQASQIRQLAGWTAHLGTVDEARYPNVDFIRGTPGIYNDEDLVGGLNAVDFGSRATIENPPAWLPPGEINMMVEGYSERINLHEWDTTLNCTPASAWTIGEVVGVEPLFDGFNAEPIIPRENFGTAEWLQRDAFTPFEGLYYLGTEDLLNGEVAEVRFELPDHAESVSFYWGALMRAGNIDSFQVFEDATLLFESTVNTPGNNLLELDLTGGSYLRLVMTRGDTGATTGTVNAQIDAMSIGVDQRAGATPLSSRVDTDESVLVDAITEAAEVFDVEVLDGESWITVEDGVYALDFPFDVIVGGERMRVLSISGAGPIQEFTVQRSINGVSRSHDSGSDLRLYQEPLIGM